ncbi:hypothetical protein LCGC14_1219050 [marine sediment metagenome]|uniref:Uncharacterized protein n=1 Tax=marine sediment metagenome TaxID=412755 RepID=A0A0F9NU48_9ZZZZ
MSFIDNIKNKAKKKYEQKKREWEDEREANKIIKEEIRTAKEKERKKQDIQTAVFKEQDKARKKRDYIKNGGFLGSVSRGVDNLSKNLAEQEKQRVKRQPKAKQKQSKEERQETIAERMENFKLFEEQR